jgi:O-antigen ligase
VTNRRPIIILAAAVLGALAIAYLLRSRPGLFASPEYLGGLILLQIICLGLWHYRKLFFPLMLGAFLLAGMNVPFLPQSTSLRWVFLAVGAFAGLLLWLNRHPQGFTLFHGVALTCVLAALISARVSSLPEVALLKVLSLFLLFLYAASGARLGIAENNASFTSGLLAGCEVTAYVTAVCYFLLGAPIFGNPNSLGAVMGVVITPVLAWGMVTARPRPRQLRLGFALFLSAALLFYSLSRAGIAAALAAGLMLCFAFRRQRVLVRVLLLGVLLAALVAVVQPGYFDQLTASVSETVIYKGKRDQGLLGSRRTPWQQTVSVIQERPWFGSGFGSEVGVNPSSAVSLVATQEEASREHGSSYLTLLQWVGLLGVLPFVLLLFLLLSRLRRVCAWMWRTASAAHPAVPLALVLVGGLVNTIFEDWLFAVGYYLTVLFWALAFGLMDLTPGPARVSLPAFAPAQPAAPPPAAVAFH